MMPVIAGLRAWPSVKIEFHATEIIRRGRCGGMASAGRELLKMWQSAGIAIDQWPMLTSA